MKIREHGLAPLLAFFIENDSLEMARTADASDGHGTHKEIPFPCGDSIGVVERDAGCRDGRHPKYFRKDHAGRRFALVQWSPVIVVSICDERPAVILSRPDHIDFV